MKSRSLELLAPAKNLQTGISAVNHGADAVYIGGPSFSARAAAANSVADVARLVTYAHKFNARVYVALNTLFYDDELEQAVQLAHKLYNAGVDALIIQDVGLLEMELPPIPLHASTQMNNQTPEKVRFLEKAGFAQVVLARELSLSRIREIYEQTTVPLEYFIHGALCVSYSGQCYISEVMAGRSANRGECAQFCRHRYDLLDTKGKTLVEGRYLLSLQDLDLSGGLQQLVNAGVRSFKIEGRLKDENYVKNVTAHYRKLLDEILEQGSYSRSSSGRCEFGFTPDPAKSFHRGGTEYFTTKKRNRVADIRSPKATGELLGVVKKVSKDYFSLRLNQPGTAIANGDGLCYYDDRGNLGGLRVNRFADGQIYVKDGCRNLALRRGAEVYRNLDLDFNKQLEHSRLCRTIDLRASVLEVEGGLKLHLVDEDGISSSAFCAVAAEKAKNPGTLKGTIQKQMNKTGGTIFHISSLEVHVSEKSFYPVAAINELRRIGLEIHAETRLQKYRRQQKNLEKTSHPWGSETLTYLDNILNSKALDFYKRHGVKTGEQEDTASYGIENIEAPELMRTRYCIKAQLDRCPHQSDNPLPDEILTLADNTGKYSLIFDCARCEMVVKKQRKSG